MANKVRFYREAKRMSAAELGRIIGFTDVYVRQIETGKRDLSMKTAVKISQALGKSLNTLFLP
jgi:transcriptional regulator with XRE-family HTH domain